MWRVVPVDVPPGTVEVNRPARYQDQAFHRCHCRQECPHVLGGLGHEVDEQIRAVPYEPLHTGGVAAFKLVEAHAALYGSQGGRAAPSASRMPVSGRLGPCVGQVWQDVLVTITAAADGSALGNPGPAGWAWYVDDNCWRAGGWPHGTNNQGELMAVLDLFRATAHLPGEDLRILCDSQYVINSVTKWMPGWKRKGWRKADGKPVLNVDLLKDIDQAMAGRKYSFEWVRGHAGHDLNEAADERARAAATAYQQGIAVRSGPGFSVTQTSTAVKERTGHPGQLPAAAVQAGSVGSAPGTPGMPTEPMAAESLRANAPHAYGEAALYEEPDLFSELEADPFAVPQGNETAPESIVAALEMELLSPEVRADIGRTGMLLHREFTEIGSSGRIWNRDAMMMELEENPGPPTELEMLAADRISPTAVLLTYRSYARSGTVLRSSLWVLDGAQWRLRFHQGTPEAQ